MRFISYVACNASQELLSSALTIVPLAMRERMNESACPSVRNTAGSERQLRYNHDGLALPGLIAGEPPIAAVLNVICGLHISPKITAIDFRDLAIAPKLGAFQFFGQGLAKFVEQHECGLIGQAKVARDGQGALAFDLIAEDRDGREIVAQWELVERKERSACNREVRPAGAATEPE